MMRITFLLLLALDMVVYAYAGSYRPFVVEGKRWEMTSS